MIVAIVLCRHAPRGRGVFVAWFLIGAALLCVCRRSGADIDPPMDVTRDAPQRIAPLRAPFDMPQLERPRFPDRTFDIREYGAEPGAERSCTKAIARAIGACFKAGGGRVLVPAGEWLTGPIHLRSNVNLHLAGGAVVRFSQNFEDDLPVVLIQRGGVRCYNYSPLIYARDCENIVIRHCAMRRGHGALTIGSEMSTGVRHVLAHDLIVNGCERAIYVKTQPGRGGFVENIHVRDVEILGVRSYAVFLNMRYSAGRSDSHLPALRDIHIERVRCRKAGRAIGLAGLAESWIENVTFTDMDLRADKSVNTRYTRGVRFDRVNITTPDSPVFTTQDTVDMTITRSRCPEGAGTFLSVGPGSASIRLIANDLSAARSSVQIAGGLAEDTVVIQDQSH